MQGVPHVIARPYCCRSRRLSSAAFTAPLSRVMAFPRQATTTAAVCPSLAGSPTSSAQKLTGAPSIKPVLVMRALTRPSILTTQSESSTRLIALVGLTAGAIMALGATFAALNSLYADVAAWALAESMALSLIGGLAGAALGWLVFAGACISSVGATHSQVAFRLPVTPGPLGARLKRIHDVASIPGLSRSATGPTSISRSNNSIAVAATWPVSKYA
jgi:hypothetical protein